MSKILDNIYRHISKSDHIDVQEYPSEPFNSDNSLVAAITGGTDENPWIIELHDRVVHKESKSGRYISLIFRYTDENDRRIEDCACIYTKRGMAIMNYARIKQICRS